MANGGSCDGTTRLYTRGGGQATSKGFSGWVGEVREKIRETRELRVKKFVCGRNRSEMSAQRKRCWDHNLLWIGGSVAAVYGVYIYTYTSYTLYIYSSYPSLD